MALNELQAALSPRSDGKMNISVADLQDHFAELVLEPSLVDPKIPFEVSDALRKCLANGEAVNRVYETIDLVLSLEVTPEGMWNELKRYRQDYSDASPAFRHSKVSDGSTYRACYRSIAYMRSQGVLSDVGGFLSETEEAFTKNGFRVSSNNEYLFLIADLYTDLLVYGGNPEKLKETFGIRKSNYVLRAVEE